MTTQTVKILNAFGGGTLERRTRTSASGGTSDRWSVTLDANPLVIDLDTKTLGRGVAATITAHLQKRVAEIGAAAAPATQLQRKYAENALSKGKTWAVKRYAGGRIGTTAPNQSHRLFNDGGRLVKGITANPTRDNNWVINVPANRLNATQLGSETALKDLVNRLRVYVPEFGSAEALLRVPEIRRAVQDTIDTIVAKRGAQGDSRYREYVKELMKKTVEEFSKVEG